LKISKSFTPSSELINASNISSKLMLPSDKLIRALIDLMGASIRLKGALN
jgi:hypothetical protein